MNSEHKANTLKYILRYNEILTFVRTAMARLMLSNCNVPMSQQRTSDFLLNLLIRLAIIMIANVANIASIVNIIYVLPTL